MKSLFGKGYELLDRVLHVRSVKNTVISSNIANVDTPGYKARELPFKKVMDYYLGTEEPKKMPLKRTNPRHLDNLHREKIARPEDFIVRSRERGTPNNVDLDVEMAKLAENNLQYQATLQVLIRRLEGLKNAVTEGGRP